MGLPTWPDVEAMFTVEPFPCASGTAPQPECRVDALEVDGEDAVLIRRVHLLHGRRGRKDARIVDQDRDRPEAVLSLLNRGRRSVGLETSSLTKRESLPDSSARARPRSSSLSATTTWAPSDAKPRACADPWPPAVPVMSTVLPPKRSISVPSVCR